MFYHRGLGIPVDLDAALKWYVVAAANGNVDARLNADMLAAELGETLEARDTPQRGEVDLDTVSSPDETRAVPVTDEIRLNAMYRLGMDYHSGRAAPEIDLSTNREFVNRSRGVELLQHAANGGHAQALMQLCEVSLRGEIVEKNYGWALDCLRQAADAGDGDAMLRLGVLLSEGLPRAEAGREAEGEVWIKRAADNGNSIAMNVVVHMCTMAPSTWCKVTKSS
jgi:TPR repeat protein